MKTLWMILAAAGGVTAVVLVFRGNFENAFLAAAAGAVCWILNYRQQLRESQAGREKENEEDEDEEVRS